MESSIIVQKDNIGFYFEKYRMLNSDLEKKGKARRILCAFYINTAPSRYIFCSYSFRKNTMQLRTPQIDFFLIDSQNVAMYLSFSIVNIVLASRSLAITWRSEEEKKTNSTGTAFVSSLYLKLN